MTDPEIAANAVKFRTDLPVTFSNNVTAIVNTSSDKIDQAYARSTTLQAWRSFVLEGQLGDGAMGFFAEAQNDGLTSIALVTGGLWRSSLKSLRSLLENMLHAFYYADHPVEYRLWEKGAFRISFQKLFEYFETHPDMQKLPSELSVMSDLKKHYGQLSKVVHASAKDVRMTNDLSKSQIWKTSKGDIGKWSTLHNAVIRDINLLALILFKDHLAGAKAKGLREAIALVVPSSKDAIVKSTFGVTLLR